MGVLGEHHSLIFLGACSIQSTSFVHKGSETFDFGVPLGKFNLSHAGYQASDPFQDLFVREVGSVAWASLFPPKIV